MKRFKKILLVASEGAQADSIIRRAVGLAKKNNAELTIVSAVQELTPVMEKVETSINLQKVQELVVEEGRKEIEPMKDQIEGEGIPTTEKVLVGTPYLEIIREVLQHGHDLVMKAAEGGGGLINMLFGTTDMHLMRKCPCPVWVFKPTPPHTYSQILAAVDPHPYDQERTALSLKILELATSLARLENSKVRVLHVWTPYAEQLLRRSRSGFNSQLVDSLMSDLQKEHEGAINRLLGKINQEGLDIQQHLLKGEPGDMIPKLAKEKQVDLIIMGTVGRTGVEGFFVGNTAEKVLHHVDCSILAIKPDDYNPPI